jgi:hypothetical protein
MPRDKDLKRLVRARMKKTGEAYTAARTQILRKTSKPTKPAPDYAKLAGMADAIVKEKTGRDWADWVTTLDKHEAERMEHGKIASLVKGTYKVADWWSQMVTVGYERIKGLRARGQRRDGSYEASKSKTFNVPVKTLFDAWNDASKRKRWLQADGVRVRTATSPKSMRLGMSDGGIVAVWFMPKGTAKSSVALAHTKLPDVETAKRMKMYWGEQLHSLAEYLKGAAQN